MSESSNLDEAFWRLPVVMERTGFSESEIRRKEQEGAFPKRRRTGDRAVAWLASEVIQWMRAAPLAEDTAAKNAPPPGTGRPRKRAA